jgi:hypothetical protein
MNQKPFEGIIPDNNYDRVNPLDASPMHPNKYELIEKRREQIDTAIQTVFAKQKNDVLKRPAVGVVTLIQRELQKKAGAIFNSEKDSEDFSAEYNTNVIIPQLCKFVGFENETDYAGLSEAIQTYYTK